MVIIQLCLNSLVDDHIVIDLVKKEILRTEKEGKSWIIEGFPRTKVQALAL
jgi:adenylate kinase family enzyme